jgi:hypothetical protein
MPWKAPSLPLFMLCYLTRSLTKSLEDHFPNDLVRAFLAGNFDLEELRNCDPRHKHGRKEAKSTMVYKQPY